jgi:hypothetical protein
MKNAIIALLISVITLALTACAGYNPQSARVPHQVECVSLQRQMLFGNNLNPGGDNQFKNQVEQRDLRKKFTELHCYRVLQQVKAAGPQK